MNTRTGNKRLSFKKYVDSGSDSETSPPSAKKVKVNQAVDNSTSKKIRTEDDDSSDSSIGDHLQRADEINLDADSFRTKADADFKSIESKILSDVNNLSDSESDSDFQEVAAPLKEQNTQPEEFEPIETKHEYIPLQLSNYAEKIEEAKRQLSKFNEKKASMTEEKLDVDELLALGESEIIQNDNSLIEDDSSCSELEDVAEEQVEDLKEPVYSIPKEGVQITVEVPGLTNKKKKALDVIACLKRKSNRDKKERQVYIHKVHLLCWLAHGNYTNAILNNENLLALALSLIPSQHCYPESRVDLKYLEQITNWYTKIVKLKPDDQKEKTNMKPISLQQSLHLQINRKEVKSKKDYVYIFICILRSLGIQCRLVLNLQVVPLRPPSSELFSLSTKTDDQKKPETKNTKTTVKKDTAKAGPSNLGIKKVESGSVVTKVQKLKSKTVECLNSSVTKKETKSKSKSSNAVVKKDIVKAGPSKLAAEKVVKKVESSCGVTKVEKLKSKTVKENAQAGPGSAVAKKETKSKHNDTVVKKELASNSKSANLKLSNETSMASSSSSNVDKDKLQVSKRKSVTPKLNENKEKPKATTRSSKTKSETSENLSQEKEPRKSPFFRQQTETSDDQKQKKAVRSKLAMLKKQGEENDSRKQKKVVKSKLTIPTEEAEMDDTPKQKRVAKSRLTVPIKEAETKASSETDTRRKKSAPKTRSKSAEIETFKILQVDGMNDVSGKKSTKKTSAKARKSDKMNNTDSEPQSSRPSRAKKVAKYTEVNSNETDSDSEDNETLKSLKKLKDKNAKTSPFFGTPAKSEPRSRLSLSARKAEKPTKNDVARSKSSENITSGFFGGSSSKTKSNLDVRSDIVSLLKSRISEQKHIDKSKLVKSKVKNLQSDDDSDYAPEPISKKKKAASDSDSDFDLKSKKKIKSKVKQLKEIDRRVLSTDSEEENPREKKKKRIGNDIWVEVFVEDEEKWISVDVTKGQVHCVQELHSRASQPVSYIIAWNNKNTLKDVSRRYCKQWNTVTRKLRVDSQWWEKSLKPFTGPKTARDKEEDEELARQQLEQPLPTTISEYKDHPLYALKRHLLKFQAIYPPDAATLGFIRNEPVYARECVYTLHSRETWIKQAKCVKIGEKPYKIVKARPKYDRATGTMITDLPLEVFGVWQVEDYKPPVAENGVVPRNCYGNVDLFKPTMLPIGTVHLQLPGLNKVARKLNIDCSPAVVGWDFHSGGSHPTFDGFVVCKEFEETLIAAWEQEQEEAERRAREKIEKRVYDNWRRIIKGLLIRERLKAKYGFGDPSTSAGGKKKKRPKGPRFVAKRRRMCSDNSDSD